MRSLFHQPFVAILVSASIATGCSGSENLEERQRGRSYQLNSAHTGSLSEGPLQPPLKELWKVKLPNEETAPSYPIVSPEGVFFIETNASSGTTVDSRLHAISRTTGQPLWPAASLGENASGFAYSNGILVTVRSDGHIETRDAAIGALKWQSSLSDLGDGFMTVEIYGGKVYVGSGSAYDSMAVIELGTGELTTRRDLSFGIRDMAIDGSGVYFSGSWGDAAMSSLEGALLWRMDTGSFFYDYASVALFGDSLFARNGTSGGLILDTQTGFEKGRFVSSTYPAFASGTMFSLKEDTSMLSAVNLQENAIHWSVQANGKLHRSPIVIKDVVYVTSSSGETFALKSTTGETMWSATSELEATWQPVNRMLQINHLTLASDGEILVVPQRGGLVAYGNAATP